MRRKQLVFQLLDDCVVSRSAVTTGAHRSLPYLPGATLLGVAASHLYTKWQKQNPEWCWLAFHSGKVRFGNALPLHRKGLLAYPVPRSWFYDKSSITEPNKAENVENFSTEPFLEDVQYQQYRDCFSTLRLGKHAFFKPAISYRLKTAINPKSGVAEQSQLFGYSGLCEGQWFSSHLEADEDVEDEVFTALCDAFLDESVFIGRSRSAEYGAVTVHEAIATEHTFEPDDQQSGVTIWCLADAVILDDCGIPTLNPAASMLGLPEGWELDTEHSFIHNHRYAPYNAKYQRRELERVALGMGSVLHFIKATDGTNKTADLTPQELKDIQDQGIGIYRQAGLGKIVVNPSMLNSHQPDWLQDAPVIFDIENLVSSEKELTQGEKEENSLIRAFMDARSKEQNRLQSINLTAENWVRELQKVYQTAYELSPHVDGQVGPGKTQWGEVMDFCKTLLVNDQTDIKGLQGLFEEKHGICKLSDADWSEEIVRDAALSTFREWLEAKIKQLTQDDPEIAIEVVAQFARLARSSKLTRIKEQRGML